MPDSRPAKESAPDETKTGSWAEWDKSQAAWKSLNHRGKRWLGVAGCYQVRPALDQNG